jgi:hypothetical protein
MGWLVDSFIVGFLILKLVIKTTYSSVCLKNFS